MVQCTIFAQISSLVQKSNVSLMSPQWRDNSKEVANSAEFLRNAFQSPQWGDNSKGGLYK